MAAVVVHGVPEIPAVWRGLLAALDRPGTAALSLPGFDSARPAGFEATMEEYESEQAGSEHRRGAALAGLRSAVEASSPAVSTRRSSSRTQPETRSRRARCDRSPSAITGFAGGLKV